MSLTAARPNGARGPDGGIESGVAEGSVTRAGHSLQQAAIADGRIVDPRPLGPALKTVMAAMLGADQSLHLSERGKGEFAAACRTGRTPTVSRWIPRVPK